MSDAELLEELGKGGDNRPSVYEEVVEGVGVRAVYRASSVGNCTRNLVAARTGMEPAPPPGWMQTRYDQGHDNEPRILRKLEEEGEWEIEGEQYEITIPVGDSVIIRGHLDATAEAKTSIIQPLHPTSNGLAHAIPIHSNCVVEAKAFATSMWEQFCKKGIAAFPYYEWQASIYSHGLGLPVLFVVGRKDEEGVVQEIKKQWIDTAPVSLARIKMKVAKVEAQAATGLLPELCDLRQFPCGYYWLGCPSKEVPESLNVEDDLLDSLAAQYSDGKKLEDEGKKKKQAASKGIKEWFDGQAKEDGKRTKRVDTQRFTIEDFEVNMPPSEREGYTMRYPKITPKDKAKGESK